MSGALALIASSKPFLRSLAGEAPMVPSSSMILPLPPVGLDRPFGDALAFLDEVRADERQIVLARLGERRVDAAVDQQHRDAGLLGGHDGGDQRLFFARRKEDEVDALGDHAVDVGDLLGGRAGGVGIDQLAAALLGFVLHAGGLRQTPRIVAFRLGEADLVTYPSSSAAAQRAKAGQIANAAALPTVPTNRCVGDL